MNKKFLYAGIALFYSCTIMAQKNPDAVKFSEVVNKDVAYKHLSVLASDAYEGRETGKKGAWMAADYIKAHFKKIGLVGPVKGGADPYFQPVGMATYDVVNTKMSINGKAKKALNDFTVSANSVSINGLTANISDVVFVGYGLNKDGYNDFEGQNIEGKVVMLFSSGDPAKGFGVAPTPGDNAAMRAAGQARQRAVAYLNQNKVKGVIMVDPNLEKTPEWRKPLLGNGRIMLKNKETADALAKPAGLMSITVTPATANEILGSTTVDALSKKIMESGKPASMSVKTNIVVSAEKKENTLKSDNVLGYLEGSDPLLKDELVVITGHYDHVGILPDPSLKDRINNGADDDGSGTTGVLLLAEAFANAKKAGKGPKRSMLFMCVTGEEKGLLGSEWYGDNPIFPMKNTITNLNIDMIGRGDDEREKAGNNNDFVYIIGSNMLSDDLDRIGKKANADYVNITLDEKYNNRTDPNRFYYRSDHYNFAKHGVPVIFYFNGVHKDYHQPGDEVDKIDFPMLAKRSQLVYFTAWELANAAKRPVVNKDADGNIIVK